MKLRARNGGNHVGEQTVSLDLLATQLNWMGELVRSTYWLKTYCAMTLD